MKIENNRNFVRIALLYTVFRHLGYKLIREYIYIRKITQMAFPFSQQLFKTYPLFLTPNHFAASFRFRNSFPVGLHVHDMDFISCHAISRTLTNYPGKGNLKTPLQVPVVYSSRPMKKP